MQRCDALLALRHVVALPFCRAQTDQYFVSLALVPKGARMLSRGTQLITPAAAHLIVKVGAYGVLGSTHRGTR